MKILGKILDSILEDSEIAKDVIVDIKKIVKIVEEIKNERT